MSNVCNTCNEPISWNKRKREELGIRGPLNPDMTVHKCYGGSSSKTTIATYDYSKQAHAAAEEQTDALVGAINKLNITIALMALSNAPDLGEQDYATIRRRLLEMAKIKAVTEEEERKEG